MLKKYFLSGLIILMPIALTFIIITYLFDFFTTPFVGIVERVLLTYHLSQHEFLVLMLSRLIVLAFLACLILLLGFLGHQFVRKISMKWAGQILSRIPLVNTIYKISKELTKAIFAQDQKTFKQTVLVPFASPQGYAIGFITGDSPPTFTFTEHVSVFIPTSPHPISGFMLIVPKTQAIPIHVSVEDAFKFLLSCGVIYPRTSASKN